MGASYYHAATEETLTNPNGLVGDLIASQGSCPDTSISPPPSSPPGVPPPPSMPPGTASASSGGDFLSSMHAQTQYVVPINDSLTTSLSLRCTTPSQAGSYALAVRAAVRQPPHDLAFQPKSQNANCRHGYVGPSGFPIYLSPSTQGALPQCNPSGAGNELKRVSYSYELTVQHRAFADGALAAHEVCRLGSTRLDSTRLLASSSGEGALTLLTRLDYVMWLDSA